MSTPICDGCGNHTGVQYTRVRNTDPGREDRYYCNGCNTKYNISQGEKESKMKMIEFDINGIQKSTSTYKDEDYITFKINIPQGLNLHINRWGRKRRYRIHLTPIGE